MIRPAKPMDMPKLLELGERMHAESPRYSRMKFSRARAYATLSRLMDSDDGFLWVAEIDDEVVGGMAGAIFPHWASDDRVASDLALFMREEYRGGMSIPRLVGEFKRWAWKRDVYIVQVGVTTGVQTEKTAQLYERLGLKRCGVILEG